MREELSKTTSLCPECLEILPAGVFSEGGKVWIEKKCGEHGYFRELYWGDSEMFKRAKRFAREGRGLQNPNITGKVKCPESCGLCPMHKTNSTLTNIVLTNRCDLNCWYCFFFAQKAGYVYEPSIAQIKEMLQRIRDEKPIHGNAIQLSLDHGELIYLRDSGGRVFPKKIGEFVDEQMAKNGAMAKRFPVEHEFAYATAFEVLSVDDSLSPVFLPLEGVIRHEIKEAIFNIKTEAGWEINCTGSHSVFVLGGGGIAPKQVKELAVGDMLLGPTGFPEPCALSEINLLELIEQFAPESLGKIMVGGFAGKTAARDFDSIENRRIRWEFVKHATLKESGRSDCTLIRYFNSVKGKELPIRLRVSAELVRLLAYYAGEGCTYRNGVNFTFGAAETELIDDLIFCIKKVFGGTRFAKKSLRGSAVQVDVSGYLYKLFFKVMGCGQHAHNKEIPWLLFNVSGELKKEFLRTYFRCDGNVKMRKSGYEINHNTVSRKLASQLVALHLQLGLVPKIEKSVTKPHLVRKTGQFIASAALKYRVVIGGKENLANALWYLDGQEKCKSRFLEYALKEEKHAPKYLRVPMSLVGGLAGQNVADKHIASILKRMRFDKSVFKQNLASVINYFAANGIPFNSFLNDLSHSKLGFFKVRQISKVVPTSKYVYDVSVPGSQAFFAGLGLLLAHNTGGEPTLREDLIDIIKAIKEVGFDHVQLNTNGIRISKDADLVKRIRAAGANTIYLSFDGITEKTNPKNHWEIPGILRNCRAAGMGIVLVPTVINTVNDHEVGGILRFGFDNMDIVRGINFQPVSLVGRMPQKERDKFRITIPDVVHALEEQTKGEISADDFYPVPTVVPIAQFIEHLRNKPQYELSAHYACGMATYLFKDGDKMVPITRFLDVEGFVGFLNERAEELRKGKSRYLVGAKLLLKFNSFIDKKKMPDYLDLGKILFNVFIKHDYKSLRVFHHKSMFVGMMHFMDLYNYDIERVKSCAIHYATPDPKKPIVPFCAFNVIPQWYRDKIQKEFGMPIAEWEKKNGRKLSGDLYRRNLKRLGDESKGKEGILTTSAI